jgi:flagellar protein FlaF
MQRHAAVYRASSLGGTSPAEAEILAFGLCNDRLAKAQDGKARVEALAKNHQLWSTLVRDLSSDANRLAPAIKSNLLQLGLWSMAYSNLALAKDLPLKPLIDVNRNLSDGLRMQSATRPAIEPAGLRPEQRA